MPKITTTVTADEKSYQEEFYSKLYGDNDKWREYVCVDRSTDGYTDGILFEHKTNVKSYGEAKALGLRQSYILPDSTGTVCLSHATSVSSVRTRRKYMSTT